MNILKDKNKQLKKRVAAYFKAYSFYSQTVPVI